MYVHTYIQKEELPEFKANSFRGSFLAEIHMGWDIGYKLSLDLKEEEEKRGEEKGNENI